MSEHARQHGGERRGERRREGGPERGAAAPAPTGAPPEALAVPEGFSAACEAMGVVFDPGDVEKLGLYLALMLETNRTTNLTAITDPSEAWTRHIQDSLTLLALLADLPEGSRVIDVGSGGGCPGVPIAVCMPGLKVTLLEATGKKVEFLERVVRELGLANVTVLNGRAESFGAFKSPHREAYDAAVARAVGPLGVVAELTVPFVKPGGQVLLIKGQKAEEELEQGAGALHVLKVVHGGTVETPTGRIVVIDKPGPTPRIYPRRDGEPKRAPLR